ncbi:hypothetical protein JCM8097_004526 [Rhodosporidiobolus ruineniae]
MIIDGVKYACQSCIKGHRSSKCTHADRPLQEIKKKGRPTSQCAHCRELRKTKSVHARCDCAARAKEEKIAPRVLPNGLADAMLLASLAEGQEDGDAEASSSGSATPLVKTEPSGVTRLLNPCNCLQGGECRCCTYAAPLVGGKKPFPGETSASTSGDCCGGGSSSFSIAVDPPEPAAPVASTSSCCGSKPSPSTDEEGFFADVQPVGQDLPTPSPAFSAGDLPVPPASFALSASTSYLPSLPGSFPVPSQGAPCLAFSPSLSSSFSTSASPTTPLFTPSTHGTSSCFCGPTCGCVGCAVHDPLGRKRPAPGACSGGGCHCGDEGVEGCGASAKGKKKARMGGGGGGCCGGGEAEKEVAVEEPAKKAGGCCGGGSKASSSFPAAPVPGTSTSSGVALPSLWSLAEEGPASPTTGEPTLAPLPSLRTLWPVLDLANTATPSSSTPFASTSAAAPAAGPAYAAVPEQLGCEAMYADASPFATACGTTSTSLGASVAEGGADGEEKEGCACSADCGCRAGLDEPLNAEEAMEGVQKEEEDAEGETDDEWVSVVKPAEEAMERELDEVAEKAAMGLFG